MEGINIEWSIVIAVIALGIALWQGFLAKQQLEQAIQTKSEIEKLLDDIKSKVQKVETISDETRKDVKEQISKLINQQDDTIKTLLSAPEKNNQNEMIKEFLPMMFQNPEMLETIVKLGNNKPS